MDSPFQIFLVGAALIVLFQMWRGWQLGLVRQLLRMVSLGAAWFAVVYCGYVLAPFFRGLGWPAPIAKTAGGIALGALVWLGIGGVGALLFKRTEHHSGVVRLGFGATGAILGAVYGLILVWVIAQSLRFLGTAAEASQAVDKNPRFAAVSPAKPEKQLARAVGPLVELKKSLETGVTGTLLKKTDPVPDEVERTLTKTTQVLGDMHGMERFLEYPGVKPLLKQPKIVELVNDPEIARAVADRDYMKLLNHPRMVAAVSDPQLAESLKQIDFEKALDYALRKPEKDESRSAL